MLIFNIIIYSIMFIADDIFQGKKQNLTLQLRYKYTIQL